MRPFAVAAAQWVLLVEGVALLWLTLAVFGIALVAGGMTAGFGGGQDAFLKLAGIGLLPLASGLAIVGSRRRLDRLAPRLVAVSGQLGVFALAAIAREFGTAWFAALAATACLGLAATALSAGAAAGPTATA